MSRVRALHFIRHGQYTATPKGGTLTALGRRQTLRTGAYFRDDEIAAIHCSTLTRAIESAHLIASEVNEPPIRKSKVLIEIMPTRIPGYPVPHARRVLGRENIETIMARYFRPSRSERHELVVCHGNLIRALLCRVTGTALSRWIRMDVHHAGITTFEVYPNKPVRLVRFNSFGHLPKSQVSES